MAKIHVNLHQGVIDIEGDEDFVRTAFKEVQGVLSGHAASTLTAAPLKVPVAPDLGTGDKAATTAGKPSSKPKKSTAKPKLQGEKGSSSGSIDKYYKAQLDPGLDTAGLKAFYHKYNPPTAKVRNLVFSAFLRDELGKNPCSANDIFSCYYAMKSDIKIPEAFGKSLTDSRNEGYVTFTSPEDISIPVVGENLLSEMLKKASQ